MEEKLAITHKCQPCDKEFTSRRAYGGHVSSHNRKKANNQEQEPETPRQRIRISNKIPPKVNWLTYPEEDEEEEEKKVAKIPCTICTRRFISKRGLGSHMRLHSEMERRGINPPRSGVANPNPAPPSDRNTSSSVDRARDPEPRSRSKSSSPTNSHEEIVRAAKTLVKMSKDSWPKNRKEHKVIKASGLKIRIRTSTKQESSSRLGESLLEKKINNNNNNNNNNNIGKNNIKKNVATMNNINRVQIMGLGDGREELDFDLNELPRC